MGSDLSDGSDWWDGSDGLGEGGFGVFGVNVDVGDVVGDGFGEATAVVFPRFLDVGAEPFVGG